MRNKDKTRSPPQHNQIPMSHGSRGAINKRTTGWNSQQRRSTKWESFNPPLCTRWPGPVVIFEGPSRPLESGIGGLALSRRGQGRGVETAAGAKKKLV